MQIFLQNCEMKSNRAGLEDSPGGGNVRAADKRGEECANLNKVPKDTNSFLTDEAKFALGKFWPQNGKAKTNKCGTRRILLLASFKAL